MKSLLVLSFLFAGVVSAADVDSKFAEQKKTVLEHMSAQMATLENTKKCVEAATDHDGIKKCLEQAREQRQKMEGARIDEKVKKLEEKKKQLEMK